MRMVLNFHTFESMLKGGRVKGEGLAKRVRFVHCEIDDKNGGLGIQ